MNILRQVANERINEYTRTAGIEFKLLYVELAITEDGRAFRDYDVHRLLKKFKAKIKGSTGREWFRVDLPTAIKAIAAVKQGKNFLSNVKSAEKFLKITFRPEQEEAIKITVKHFKRGNEFLWNAKMRFGKTLCALEVAKRMNFAKTIILTHRPIVNANWFDDFNKIFHDTDYVYFDAASDIEHVENNFIYFASIQNLRGSEIVGGKFDKNSIVFETEWDFVIVDEAHEGTTTALGDSVIFRHALWIIPGIKEGRALSKLLKCHKIFSGFEIVNVAGNGDSEDEPADALQKVRNALDNYEYTITLSCGKLTAGVTVPEWTAIFMLAGSYSTSAMNYLQTIFRVQSPCNKDGKVKQNCFVFDFAPDRTLKMLAESAAISTRSGQNSARQSLDDLLNFCPVIAVEGSAMKNYDADKLLQQLKRAYAERAVRNGFDDNNLYNDNLFNLDEHAIKQFKNLRKIIGAAKAQNKTDDIIINAQGLTNETREKKSKLPRQFTDEQKFIAEQKRVRANAIF